MSSFLKGHKTPVLGTVSLGTVVRGLVIIGLVQVPFHLHAPGHVSLFMALYSVYQYEQGHVSTRMML